MKICPTNKDGVLFKKKKKKKKNDRNGAEWIYSESVCCRGPMIETRQNGYTQNLYVAVAR
jgi:hypothetical protein